ncbi:MAG: histidinol-phosphate transaminase [Thermotogae bacterium]|nr:histidinol-phosphate transaminase [Thermotogota bacterium]RKX52824.1 MAG: histidinol-phosphate transaminase [Thermotoga sp.]
MRIRREIENFKPYILDEPKGVIFLNKNENPFDLPEELKSKLLDSMRKIPFNRYPDIVANPLREKLAEFLGLGVERIVVGNGSDDLIPYFIKIFEGDKVVISSPTFKMYEFFARLEGAEVLDIPLDEDFEIVDLEKHVDNVRVVFICSPNNPTGNLQRREKILKVLETGVPVVIDEAYHEFASENYLDLLDDFDNLIILRTFSKAFGLAGIRIGYAVANEEIISTILKIRPPFAMSSLSMKIGELMMDNYEIVKERVRFIIEERERIRNIFSDITYPSETNFLLMDVPAYDFLLERGIVVRKMDGRLSGKIRVTVGRREENDAFISALKDFLG